MSAQFTLAMVLLVGAGLLINSFLRVAQVDPGFRTENLLTMQVFLSPVEYPEGDPKAAVVLHAMLERIRAVPGVRSASVVNSLPISGGPDTDFVIADRPIPAVGAEPSANIRVVDPSYFRTMGIPLRAGREFTEADSEHSARVVLINASMARQFWPNENPVGKRITMKDWGPPLTGEIAGVVGDVKPDGLDAGDGPMIYWSYHQFPQDFNSIVVRGDSDPMKLVSAVKQGIWSVDKNQTVSRIQTMEQVLRDSLAQRRLYVILLGTFAGAALILAAVGIYGVMSYTVALRTPEIGLRMALGAESGAVMRMVLGAGLRLALIGIAVGLAASLAVTRLMESFLFNVKPTDPVTFLGVTLMLIGVACVACWIPALRARRVDPMVALRNE